MRGGRVCAECCRLCEYHTSWSGIWKCTYKTPETVREQAVQARQNEFEAEVAKISEAYRKRKKEEARLRAIKDARAGARYKRQNLSGR